MKPINWIFFIMMFLAVYGGAHTLMFLKLKTALGLQSKGVWVLGIWMILMVLAPLGERLLERSGAEILARGVAYAGSMWMGVLFVMLMTYAALSAGRALLWGLRQFAALPAFWTFSDAGAVLAALGLALAVAVYGWTEAHFVRTKHVRIASPKLSQNSRIKIAQISDVHLGLINRNGMLRRITAILRREQPDLLVSTGDLVDGELNNLACLEACLQDIHPRLGKFAVIGNHEVYAGLDASLDYTRGAGFTLLRHESATLGGSLNLAGVDDPAVRMLTGQPLPSERSLLEPLPRGLFTVLLKHQPRVSGESRGLFDLQLSGHTHGGQIFPFGLFTYLAYHVHHGLTPLGSDAWLYVSRGTGTWGPPFRFLAPPEVTIFELEAPSAKK